MSANGKYFDVPPEKYQETLRRYEELWDRISSNKQLLAEACTPAQNPQKTIGTAVSTLLDDMWMAHMNRKYKVTKRFSLDFEVVVQGRNETEALLVADSIEITEWKESNFEWKLINVSMMSPLVLVETKDEIENLKPVIKIWELTKAKGI